MGSDDLKYKKWSSSLQQIVRMRITLVNMPKINGHLWFLEEPSTVFPFHKRFFILKKD